MKATRSVIFFLLLVSPITSLVLALVIVNTGNLLPKAIAQTASHTKSQLQMLLVRQVAGASPAKEAEKLSKAVESKKLEAAIAQKVSPKADAGKIFHPTPLVKQSPTVPVEKQKATENRAHVAAKPAKKPHNNDPFATLMAFPQVRAFLDTIAWAETGTIASSAYQTLVFNGYFSDFSTHPKTKRCAAIGDKFTCSTAAGRYQIMDFNWDKLAPQLRLKDFSPQSQDKIALYLIWEKGAMEDVLAGRFEIAACKVGGIWASFPCNNYEQNPQSMEVLWQVYQQVYQQHWAWQAQLNKQK